ncbi:hypothetical protein D3C71_2238820 [compost metagenome]
MGSIEHQNYESEAIVRIGGAYEITLRINTYYGPHISFGIDEVKVEVGVETQNC